MKPSRRQLLLLPLAILSLPVSAAPADTAPKLETVIVIGEKTHRSLMETSSSLALFDDEDLARRAGLNTMGNLLEMIPNLVGVEPSNLAPAVRGADGTGPAQGADAFFAGTRPRLNYQIDGRSLSYNEAIFSDSTLWDVERIEVFRGPQSTLQGRNAIAGAVVVKTHAPSYEFEAGGQLIAGERHTRRASVYLSGPLIEDQLAFRLTADRHTWDSFVDFIPFEGLSEPEQYKQNSVRGKLLFEPQAWEGFSALLTLDHRDHHAPQTAEVRKPYKDLEASYPFQPRFGILSNGGILDVSLPLSGALSLQTVISATDITVTREAVPGDGNSEIDLFEWVLEPRLNIATADGRLSGFVGLHIFRSEQDEYIDMFGGGTFDDRTDTNAVFGELTYALTGRLDLTIGGRYEEEKRDRLGGVGPFLIDFEETYREFLPKTALTWALNDSVTIGAVVARGYNGGGAGFTYDAPYLSYTFDPEFVWNFETFLRTSLMEDRLQLTGNLFYNRYKDMQLPFDLNPDPNAWSYVVRNADEAITYGAELQSRLLLKPGLEVFANLGLLKTEVSEYPDSEVEGNDLARAPAYSLNTGVFYTHDSGLELGFDIRASDAYHSTVVNEARGKTDPYWLANARIGYRFDHVRVFAEVTNLFDRIEPVLLSEGATPADDIATVTQPRTLTLGVAVNY